MFNCLESESWPIMQVLSVPPAFSPVTDTNKLGKPYYMHFTNKDIDAETGHIL